MQKKHNFLYLPARICCVKCFYAFLSLCINDMHKSSSIAVPIGIIRLLAFAVLQIMSGFAAPTPPARIKFLFRIQINKIDKN